MKRENCPTCGHLVESVFDHLGIECTADMTKNEIAELLDKENSINKVKFLKT